MKKSKLFLSVLMLTTLFSCSHKKVDPSSSSSLPSDITSEAGSNSESTSSQGGGLDVAWATGRTYVDETKLSGEIKNTTSVRVHYSRKSGDFTDWDLWSWVSKPESAAGAAFAFSMYDDYGVITDVPITAGTTEIGVIVRKGGDNWTSKDIDKDRFVAIPEQTSDGIYDIYLGEGKEKIFENKEDVNKEMVLSAYASYDSENPNIMTATVVLDCEFDSLALEKISIYEGENQLTDFTGEVNRRMKRITLKFAEGFEYDFSKKYKVKYHFSDENISEMDLALYGVYDSPSFSEKFNYDGDDLGVTFSADKTSTTFKLWAPISDSVKLNIYNSGTKSATNKPVKTINLDKKEKGVWETTINEYLHGKYYTFVVTNAGEENEVVDPYAKSCGLNGRIGMIVDFDKINEELNWDQVKRPVVENYVSNVDATIYEIHVRDMTIDSTSGVSEKNRGKFLGLSETGTTYTSNGKTVSTGLDHIKELGVTHVQIQPFYDYNSVDESTSTGYNWGYDPLNYNCLEGSYSSNPTDGLVRIKEFKTMMKAMLENNIQVNMDVVYNHTAESVNSNFERIIPGYYHRLDSTFSFSNGSGCGNEMATDHYMYRKFVVDSCKFWLSEYKLSGYRFDLMGLIDLDTMKEIYTECTNIYDKAMVYGEPWTGGTSALDSTLQTNQSSIERIKTGEVIAAFNDKIRNGIKGNNNPSTGWVQSGGVNSPVKNGLLGAFNNNSEINPNCVINYVSCHDNYTLYDHLDKTITKSQNLENIYKQCESIIFTGQGATFIQEGEEFLRTKKAGVGDQIHNSYNAGDEVNKMDYNLKIENEDMVKFFKELIQFRKDNALFRLGSRELIKNQMNFLTVPSNNTIAFTLTGESEQLLVIHTVNALENYDLGGSYVPVFSHEGKLANQSAITTISLDANSSIVLRRA